MTCNLRCAALPAAIVEASQAKPRKFTETIELQIGLKNYDPQKDKRFSGTVKLPYMPRPQMKVCCLSAAVTPLGPGFRGLVCQAMQASSLPACLCRCQAGLCSTGQQWLEAARLVLHSYMLPQLADCRFRGVLAVQEQ